MVFHLDGATLLMKDLHICLTLRPSPHPSRFDRFSCSTQSKAKAWHKRVSIATAHTTISYTKNAHLYGIILQLSRTQKRTFVWHHSPVVPTPGGYGPGYCHLHCVSGANTRWIIRLLIHFSVVPRWIFAIWYEKSGRARLNPLMLWTL